LYSNGVKEVPPPRGKSVSSVTKDEVNTGRGAEDGFLVVASSVLTFFDGRGPLSSRVLFSTAILLGFEMVSELVRLEGDLQPCFIEEVAFDLDSTLLLRSSSAFTTQLFAARDFVYFLLACRSVSEDQLLPRP
jgi:hypothetical protein